MPHLRHDSEATWGVDATRNLLMLDRSGFTAVAADRGAVSDATCKVVADFPLIWSTATAASEDLPSTRILNGPFGRGEIKFDSRVE